MSDFPQVIGYKIIKFIGKGSTSMVYLAYSEANNEDLVAIKVVDRNKLCKKAEKAVISEIEMMEKYKHKHIVEMIEYKCSSRYIFIILEYCNGGDLSMYIKKHSKLPEKVCCTLMQQLALAIKFLRSYNICHLDLKPQNLFLTETSQFILKVGDFGLAKYMCEKTVLKSFCGSPLYMAPEMLLRKQYDIKADLWSVGVIIYECIFGQAPYAKDTLRMLRIKVKEKLPLVIPSGEISPECKHLLIGLLQYNPADRLNYDQFFKHPFLDLERMPSSLETCTKGLGAIIEAIQFDLKQQYKEAFDKYCTGLQYMLPIFEKQPEGNIKEKFKVKLNEYITRAEKLKYFLIMSKENMNANEIADKCSILSIADEHSPSLISLCQNTPQLASAVEITMCGQMYLDNGNYEEAIKKYNIGLNLLDGFLEKEPPGIRYDLLNKHVIDWKNQFESTKVLLQSNDQIVNNQALNAPVKLT